MPDTAYGLGFQHLPRDLANVNAWKTMFDPYILGANCKRAELSKINDNRLRKMLTFPLNRKKNFFFGKYQKYFLSLLKISAVLLVLRTREIPDIFTHSMRYIWILP